MKNKRVNTTPQKPLTPAMEDYLEAIYNLGREKRAIRVKDIALLNIMFIGSDTGTQQQDYQNNSCDF